MNSTFLSWSEVHILKYQDAFILHSRVWILHLHSQKRTHTKLSFVSTLKLVTCWEAPPPPETKQPLAEVAKNTHTCKNNIYFLNGPTENPPKITLEYSGIKHIKTGLCGEHLTNREHDQDDLQQAVLTWFPTHPQKTWFTLGSEPIHHIDYCLLRITLLRAALKNERRQFTTNAQSKA